MLRAGYAFADRLRGVSRLRLDERTVTRGNGARECLHDPIALAHGLGLFQQLDTLRLELLEHSRGLSARKTPSSTAPRALWLTTMAEPEACAEFANEECRVTISRLSMARLLVTFQGRDRGQLGREPFIELEKHLSAARPLELFIDLQSAVGASLDVSGSWAIWLRSNKERLAQVSMLIGSPFIQMSAQAVQRFSELGEKARIYSDRSEFEKAFRDVGA